ncbi:MAG TPA: hypothetical protein VKA30_12790 [Actinomycetota bacterium]|nr:hypothetical protein [Actinomycetota bacterium]
MDSQTLPGYWPEMVVEKELPTSGIPVARGRISKGVIVGLLCAAVVIGGGLGVLGVALQRTTHTLRQTQDGLASTRSSLASAHSMVDSLNSQNESLQDDISRLQSDVAGAQSDVVACQRVGGALATAMTDYEQVVALISDAALQVLNGDPYTASSEVEQAAGLQDHAENVVLAASGDADQCINAGSEGGSGSAV